MSDILEKLLGVEKEAAGLVGAAEAEAGKRKNQTRVDAQKQYTEQLKEKASSVETDIDRESEKIKSEREAKNSAYRVQLAAHPQQASRFRSMVLEIIEKGGK